VEDGGPARDAGIQPGDVITQINGRVPANREEFLVHLFGAPVGTKLKLEILRDGKTFETQYSVQEEPEH
jgi:S1-C subfamily serine protease